jgi:hypothetical protein
LNTRKIQIIEKMKKIAVMLLAFLFTTELLIGQISAQDEEFSVIQSFRPGLISISELNFGFGLGNTDADYAKRFFGLTSILGYGITKNLQAGIGAGLSFYNGGTLVPFFLDLRFIINLGKISAYAFGDGGLLFSFSESDYENNILLNPGVGINYQLGTKLTANLGAGLLSQTSKDKEHDSFVNLKLGITYKFGK